MYTNLHLKMETIANPCMFACLAFMIRSTSETTGKKTDLVSKDGLGVNCTKLSRDDRFNFILRQTLGEPYWGQMRDKLPRV